MIDKLQDFGLNEKEARLYLAALELGEASVQRLAKKSKIKRTTVYDTLEALKDKGLIFSSLRDKHRYYTATDPRELEQKLEEKKVGLRAILPELLSITNLIDKKPKIKFYEGDEGLKEIYLDTLNYPEQPIWAWVTDDVFDVLDEDFLYYYLNTRVKKKIPAYVIVPDTPDIRKYRALDQKFLRRTKVDSSNGFSTKVEIDLYGQNKIGIMSFKEKIGFIVESQNLFDTLKSIFNSSWERLG